MDIEKERGGGPRTTKGRPWGFCCVHLHVVVVGVAAVDEGDFRESGRPAEADVRVEQRPASRRRVAGEPVPVAAPELRPLLGQAQLLVQLLSVGHCADTGTAHQFACFCFFF